MLILLVPLVSLALGTVPPVAPAIEARSPRAAQVRLAEMIGEADAIHAIVPRRAKATAKASRIELAIDRDGIAYRVVAEVGKRGEVTGLTVDERGPSRGEIGNLSWLSSEIAYANAIVRVAVDEDDAITLTTDGGDAFMIIPGRGSGGNAAARARWAGAWDSPEA
jgi:hypothetical protein